MMLEENEGFPLSYRFILKKIMPPGRLKVLDLGCGKGVAGELLNSKKIHEFIGIDVYKPYLKICKRKGYYNELVKADITRVKIKNRGFDVILLLQVIEHLEKKTAIHLIKKAFKAARKKVIVSVPNGDCYQEAHEGNPYHKHISRWSASELKELGFKVYGQGLKIIYGSESYVAGRNAHWWQKIVIPISLIFSPIVTFYPQIAAQLIGVKYIK